MIRPAPARHPRHRPPLDRRPAARGARRARRPAPRAGAARRAHRAARRADRRRGGAPAGDGAQRAAPAPVPARAGDAGTSRLEWPGITRPAAGTSVERHPAAVKSRRPGSAPADVGGPLRSGGRRGAGRRGQAAQQGAGHGVVVAQALGVRPGPGERAGHADVGVRADREAPRVHAARPRRAPRRPPAARGSRRCCAARCRRRRRRISSATAPRRSSPASSGSVVREALGSCSRASTITVAVTDSPGTAVPPARKQPAAASTSVHIPGPRNRTNPARDSASSCRTRNPGGPLATALKKPCHQPTSRAFERAVSAPSVTSGRDLRVHRQHRHERAEVRGVRGVDVLVQVVGDVRRAPAAAARRASRRARRRADGPARRSRSGPPGRAPPRRAAPPSPGSPSPRRRSGR